MKVEANQTVIVNEPGFWPFKPGGPFTEGLSMSMNLEQAAELARGIHDALCELGYELGAWEEELLPEDET